MVNIFKKLKKNDFKWVIEHDFMVINYHTSFSRVFLTKKELIKKKKKMQNKKPIIF